MSWLLLPVIAKLWVMQDYNLLYFLYRRLSKCCFPNSHVDKLDLFLRIFWNLPSLREQIVCIRIHGIFCPLSLQNRRKVLLYIVCCFILNYFSQIIDESILNLCCVLRMVFIPYVICLWDEENSFAIQGRIED